MQRLLISLILASSLQGIATAAPGYDYFEANRETIRRGMQAIMMCNGLFTSGRTLEQIFAQDPWPNGDRVEDYAPGENVVRRGLDYGEQGFDRWDLLREVVKAFPPG